MNITPGFDTAQAFDGGINKLPAGGYVCRILKAWVETIQNGSEQLVLALDIAEGEHNGFFGKQYKARAAARADAQWPCLFRQFTLGTNGQTNPFFKGLLKSVQESNPGYTWGWQEATLQGKLIGIVFREEEFLTRDGDIKSKVSAAFVRSIQRIREGVEVPEPKRWSGTSPSSHNATNGYQRDLVDAQNDKLPWEEE